MGGGDSWKMRWRLVAPALFLWWALLGAESLLQGSQSNRALMRAPCSADFSRGRARPRGGEVGVGGRGRGIFPLRLSFLEDLSVTAYDAQLFMSSTVETQLQTASWTSCGVLYLAGLLTSFSPCAISLLPLTLAYLGASSAGGGDVVDTRRAMLKSVGYAAGLASTFAAFGLASALLGQLFGSSATTSLGGSGLPTLFTALVSVVMGLNLLDIVQFSFPSLVIAAPAIGDSGGSSTNTAAQSLAFKVPEVVQAFALGSSSTLIASPCSSPVLTSLLAFVATSGNPSLGAVFLFIFSLGYATPVVAAASISGLANSIYSAKGIPWFNTAIAAVLISFGTYSALDSVLSVK